MIAALITVLLMQIPIPTFVPMQSPTPIPTSTPIVVEEDVDLRTGDIYNNLATAEGNLREAPENIVTGWLPDQTGYQLFSYVKWMVSPQIGDEVFGPFGGLVPRLGIIIGIQIVLAVIYFIIFLTRLIIRFIQWIIVNILRFIPFMG